MSNPYSRIIDKQNSILAAYQSFNRGNLPRSHNIVAAPEVMPNTHDNESQQYEDENGSLMSTANISRGVNALWTGLGNGAPRFELAA